MTDDIRFIEIRKQLSLGWGLDIHDSRWLLARHDALEQRLREARELLEQRSLWGDWSRVADGEVAISNYEQWSVWWEKVDTFLAKQP